MKQKLNLRFLMTLLVGVFVSVSAFAQNITVKGHVKDNLGEVAGATVLQKGTSNGCVTDLNGDFTLSVPRGATLVVSFVGYISQEVKAASTLNILLVEDSKLLDEQVVIGYAKVKRADATGAVTAIKPDEMTKGITTSAQDMLVGKIAGVSVITNGGTPGGGASIRIRGGSSLNASNDPLIVIDGLAMDNNGVQGLSNAFAMVNPEDIESMTVLKDASATAIYGSRASNGVIIITTKKAQKGRAPKVTYNGNISLSTTRKRYDVMSGDEYRAYVDGLEGLSDAVKSQLGTANTDWQKEIYRVAVSTDHQIGVTGTLKEIPYRVSLGYTDQNGVAKTSNFQRFTSSLNLTPSLLDDHLTIGLNAKYMYGHNRYVPGGVFGSALSADPTQPVYADYYAAGGYWQNLNSKNADKYTQDTWVAPVTNTNTPQNPYALIKNQNDRAHSNVLIGNISFDYKIHGLEDLSLHANVGGDYSEGTQNTSISPYSYSNNYYGYTGVSQSYKYNLQGNFFAQYEHNFNDVQNLDIMAGVEQQHFNRKTYSHGGGNYLGDVLVTDPADYYSPTLRSETAHTYRNSLLSYFGRLNYNLLGRYLLTGTARWDGSSRFSKGNKWGFFPSVAVAWKINEEAFLKEVSAIDELKLRLGWGITGQQNIGYDFYYTPRYVVGDQYAQYPLGTTNYYITRPEVYNKDLKWEKTTTFNIGLDYSFLNGRVDGSVEWYHRKTTDLLSSVNVASGTNFGNYVMKNIGDLVNKGVEFNITARPVVAKGFTWQVNYNFTYNINKITSLTSADPIVTGGNISYGLTNKVQAHAVDHAANSFWVYQQVYDEAGKPIQGLFVDRNGDGQINDNDRYFYKSPDADITMGFTNKLVYKNWDFSFTMRASLNNYLYYDFLGGHALTSASAMYSNSAFSNKSVEAVRLGFTGDATNYWCSDYFVRNASFLRVDNITLGYSFNGLGRTAKYNGVNGRVYGLVQNPFVFTKYKGIDPELTHGTGVDSGVYPRPISVLLGLSLNF